MHKVVLLAASLAVFLSSGFSVMADSAAPAAATTDPNAPDPDKIICHAAAPVVGTRLGAKRECATQREWDQRRADAQKALNASQDHTFMQSH